MNAASLRMVDFERDFEDRGASLLDNIFSANPNLRNQVMMQSPQQCCDREVLLKVDYSEPAELKRILGVICGWISKEGNISELESIMLF